VIGSGRALDLVLTGRTVDAAEALAIGLVTELAERPVERALELAEAIAAISGWCVAGGLELALWADLRIATSTARFGVLTRRHGLPFIDGGTQRLPRVVGLPRALDLLMTGREIDAAEAERIALVNEVVEPGRHMERALEVAALIAGHPPDALLADRRAAVEGYGLPLERGLAVEARVHNLPLEGD